MARFGFHKNLDPIAQRAIGNRHLDRQKAQKCLRDKIALFAGHLKAKGLDDASIYRYFYFSLNVDVATAQTLNTNDAEELEDRIEKAIDVLDNKR